MNKIAIFSLFFIIGLSNAQADLANAQKAIFIIKGPWVIKDNVQTMNRGSGFIIEDNVMVTNFHVLDSLLDDISDNSNVNLDLLHVENTNGQKLSIESIRGVDLIADIALLKVRDFHGQSILLGDISSKENADFFLMGFPKGEFKQMYLTRSLDVGIFHEFSHYLRRGLLGASGAPILNDKGELVAVLSKGTAIDVMGANVGRLEELLDKTSNQEIREKNILAWVQGEIDHLKERAIEGDSDSQYTLGRMFRYGIGVDQNDEQMLAWYNKAAVEPSSHPEAQYVLGNMFFGGEAVVQNYGQAITNWADNGTRFIKFPLKVIISI